METRISHSIRRSPHFTETCLLLAFMLVIGSNKAHAQALAKEGALNRSSPARITEWEDTATGALHLLHRLFPDINPESKTIILDNNRWGRGPAESDDVKLGHSAVELLSFAIFVCAPEVYRGTPEQLRDTLNSYTLHCSGPTLFADVLMSGSQIGPVPGHIMVGRPDFDKRWSEISATLQAHAEWSKVQKEEAMRDAGVKYGEDSHDQVIGPINDSVKKLKPFLGKLVIDSMDYMPPSSSLSSKELSIPVWNVEAHPLGQDKNKPRTTYTLLFSAFDGAFVGEQASIAGGPPR